MSWVGLVSFLDACRAIVEVWAVHALVTDAPDVLSLSVCIIETNFEVPYLVTAIANRAMAHVAPRRAKLSS